jgi:hypothetical protein
VAADLSTMCCSRQPADSGAQPNVCGFAPHHEGPHEWAPAITHVTATRSALDPRSMRDVVDALTAVYGDDGVATALAFGGVPGGKYRGLSAIEVCCTAEGRYEVWAAAKAMAGGDFG